MIETAKEFRVAIMDDLVRSLSFTVKRHNGDVYWICREIVDVKHSLHESGVHRLAINSDDPRLPMDRATLTHFNPDGFVTVGRMIFTTAADWRSYSRGGSLRRGIRLPLSDFQMISLGFTQTHPTTSPDTNLPENLAVLEVSNNKFLTATASLQNRQIFLRDMITHHAPNRNASFFKYISPRIDGRVDILYHYRTKLNTFIYWAHHGVPVDEAASAFERHPIGQAILSAYRLSLAGIDLGSKPFQNHAE